MRELEALLNKRCILKAEDKELYYKVRDQLGEIRKFASDKLGCHIIENALLVKLEKIPVIPESFMGVQEFTSKEEYAFLCLLLMFLEDKDPQEQFILSQLTEYVSSNMPNGSVDALAIYQLIRPENAKFVSVMPYLWNGYVKKLLENEEEVELEGAELTATRE